MIGGEKPKMAFITLLGLVVVELSLIAAAIFVYLSGGDEVK
jgi:hypothetical protein